MDDMDVAFVFAGNNPAVDFVNTEMVIRGKRVDLLQSESGLTRWARQAGLALVDTVGATDVAHAIKLRRALKTLFLARIDHALPPDEALAVINRYLSKRAVNEVFRFDSGEGAYSLQPDARGLSVPAWLAELARAGAALLASPQSAQLKRCGNPECILLFLDVSRNQKRTWCSMSTCGNRAKVARHYRNSARPAVPGDD